MVPATSVRSDEERQEQEPDEQPLREQQQRRGEVLGLLEPLGPGRNRGPKKVEWSLQSVNKTLLDSI